MLTFFNVIATLGLIIMAAQLFMLKFYPEHLFSQSALHGYKVARECSPWWTSKSVMTVNNFGWLAITLYMGWEYLAVTAIVGITLNHFITSHIDNNDYAPAV